MAILPAQVPFTIFQVQLSIYIKLVTMVTITITSPMKNMVHWVKKKIQNHDIKQSAVIGKISWSDLSGRYIYTFFFSFRNHSKSHVRQCNNSWMKRNILIFITKYMYEHVHQAYFNIQLFCRWNVLISCFES